MYAFNPDYSKRDCSLPPGCKDLIDVIQQRQKAKWKTFFDSYRKLTYDIARKAGLKDGEAQEVVQEVIKAVEQGHFSCQCVRGGPPASLSCVVGP